MKIKIKIKTKIENRKINKYKICKINNIYS